MKAFEDIAIGDRSELGSYRFTAEEIIRFAKAFDPQPFHTSEESAAASHFGGLIASGWHTASVFMKLYVAFDRRHDWPAGAETERGEYGGPSPGFEDLRWLKPVHAGDTLSYVTEVTEKRDLGSMPGWGLVIFRSEAHNQNGELAYSFTGKVFVRRRSP